MNKNAIYFPSNHCNDWFIDMRIYGYSMALFLFSCILLMLSDVSGDGVLGHHYDVAMDTLIFSSKMSNSEV